MFRKIALCAMLLLVLAPVAVLAAGGQGQGTGAAGSGQHIQPAGGMPAQEQVQGGYGQAEGIASRNGEMQMLRNRTCDQTCEQDRTMIRNMTRDQLRTCSGDQTCEQDRAMIRNMTRDQLRTCSGDQTCEQDRAMIRNMTRDQLRTDGNIATGNRQQGSPADRIQNRYGALQGSGQTIQTGQAETTGSQSDRAGGASPAFRRGFSR